LNNSNHPNYSNDAEAQLMVRVSQDDAEAYQRLLLIYQPRIMRLLQHTVGSSPLAEDLTQDVFLRVWRARKTYQPTARFSTWIFHIAHNVASNAIRDRSRKREVQTWPGESDSTSVRTVDQVAYASTGAMPVRNFDKAERAELVQTALQALSPRQRTALLLSKFEDLSYEEIGQAMEMSIPAVKSLLSRARVNLRNLLQPYFPEEHSPFPNSDSESIEP
jgi:RNA polymerase sigma-70 factor (ECF subfamily)